MSPPGAQITPDEAKALVAGGLGEVMQKFPLRFCKPILFGLPPSPAHPSRVNNGTATLIRMNGEWLVVTCAHVLAHYRKVRQANADCFFAIGNCHFDPLPQIVTEDDVLDVCVIRLSGACVGENRLRGFRYPIGYIGVKRWNGDDLY